MECVTTTCGSLRLDHLHLPSNPWDWLLEEPSFLLGSIPAGDWQNSCLGFLYVKVFLLLSPTLPETLAFDHFETKPRVT